VLPLLKDGHLVLLRKEKLASISLLARQTDGQMAPDLPWKGVKPLHAFWTFLQYLDLILETGCQQYNGF